MFQVEWIPDLLDAMFRLQHSGVDVVLLDLGLAEMDGYRSFRAIDEMTEGSYPSLFSLPTIVASHEI